MGVLSVYTIQTQLHMLHHNVVTFDPKTQSLTHAIILVQIPLKVLCSFVPSWEKPDRRL